MARSPSPTYAPALRQAPPTGLFSSPPTGSVRIVSGFGFRGWRAFTIAAAAAAVLSAAFVTWTALRLGGDQATVAVDDIGEAVAALIAAASCGLAAARTSNRTRLAWAFFAASAVSWGIGEVVWSIYEVGMGVSVPFPSAADAGFLLAIPLAVAGVFAFTSAPGRLATRGEALLTGAIIALSLLFVAWALGLGKVYDMSTASPPVRLIGLAYPIGDIITITVLVLALRRARRSELGSMFLLLGGLAAAALADSAFAYLTASGAYGTIGSLLDAGWVIGYLMIALAPIWPATDKETVRAEGPIELWQLALPWAAVVAAAVTAIKLVSNDQVLDRFETVLAGCIGLLLVGSQVLSHRDSLSLLVNSRRTENQLERRNSLLNEIVTHAPLGIVRVGPDMRIIDVNPRMAALMRADSGQMIGRPVAAYLDPSELTRVFELFQPLWKGAVDSIESDSRAVRGDRTSAWLHWSATTVRNAAGRIEYFLAMYEDTDAQHAANEAATAHLAGIERLNQLKSEFITLVSHEFRTGLVGIQGFSEMIRDSDDLAREDIKALAADINKDAQRLNRMIEDILRLSRKVQRPTEPLVLAPVVATIMAEFLETHAVPPELIRMTPIGAYRIWFDGLHLQEVLLNLLSNALRYASGLPASIRIDIVPVSASRLELHVQDDGASITPEVRAHLFEPFYTTSSKGTGLGLYLARELCLNNGAVLDYEYRTNASDIASGRTADGAGTERAAEPSGRFVITFVTADFA